MTLEQLRIFVAVAEREHMTRAAEALGLAQSAASASVAALEARHDTVLFHRVGRRIELTDAGRLFLAEAKAVLARAAAAELALAELGGLRRGTLAVHASQTIASYWLPRYLVRFRRTYPEVAIHLGVGNTAQVAESVLAGAAEVGFVEGIVDDDRLANEIIATDRLVLVVAADHPRKTPRRIVPNDLSRLSWVLREPGSGTRSEFEAALRRFGIDPATLKVALELPSNEAVRAAAESGAGATVISELVAAAGLRSGALRRLSLDLPTRPFQALWHNERYRSKASQALLAMIKDGTADPDAAVRAR